MSRIYIFVAVLLLGSRVAAQDQPATAVKDISLHPISAGADTHAFASDAERQLLDLANQARLQAGLSPLRRDEGLTDAARAHAEAMAAQSQLSHQLSGEPALPQRLAAKSQLHLDRAGENVAFAGTVEQAEDDLMHSPQHRENLLDPDFNVAGFAVVQNGPRLYVVQDFGHSLQSVSYQQADNAIARHISLLRSEVKLPLLQELSADEAKSTACAMAHADSLRTPSPAGKYILRYTAMQPDTLPSNIAKIISDPSVKSFAAGACYAKTTTYPTGAYWVVVVFY